MADPLKIYLQDSAFAHCEFSNNPLPVKQRTNKVEWVRDTTYYLMILLFGRILIFLSHFKDLVETLHG